MDCLPLSHDANHGVCRSERVAVQSMLDSKKYLETNLFGSLGFGSSQADTIREDMAFENTYLVEQPRMDSDDLDSEAC